MPCMVESLGLSLPGNAAIPAADSRRRTLAQLSGRRMVDLVREDLRLSKILTRDALENAIMINAAIGGSTNFVVHLLAIAGRLNLPLSLEDFDQLGSRLPLLVNLMPSGQYLMEDFYYAGGLPAVIRELLPKLHGNALTVNGKTLHENNHEAPCHNPEVIRPWDQPVTEEAGIAVLGGVCRASNPVVAASQYAAAVVAARGGTP